MIALATGSEQTPEPVPPPIEWDSERADDRAYEAIRYLAKNYPECAGSPALDPHRDAVHTAAVGEDMLGYEEALRALMWAGRSVALMKRGGTEIF